ncbi:MAG: L,D-transpeptidase [Muribaculaceae bacterium]|nr:L,D-transpeptidase [Muribaculaceae bacterium]
MLLTYLLLVSATLLAQNSDIEFPQQVVEMLKAYPSTSEPVLPEPEGWDEITSDISSVPGRMRIPKGVVVDKPHTRLYVINVFGDTLARYRVCASREKGQKSGKDDWRTPEGTFKIYGVYNSTDWTYKDTQDKCYGPFFIALYTPPFYGIGIHGTNSPYSVPGRRSHGCMRMRNEDIVNVRRMVDKDSRVTVLPDSIPEEQSEP